MVVTTISLVGVTLPKIPLCAMSVLMHQTHNSAIHYLCTRLQAILSIELRRHYLHYPLTDKTLLAPAGMIHYLTVSDGEEKFEYYE